jgi:hypothetical protein
VDTEHGRLLHRSDIREEREIQRTVELHHPLQEGEWRTWVTFDGQQWYETDRDTPPMYVIEVPEGPWVSFDDLQGMAEAEGTRLIDGQAWYIEERAYELLTRFGNLYLEGYPELQALQEEVARLVAERMGIADLAEAERVLRWSGMPDW